MKEKLDNYNESYSESHPVTKPFFRENKMAIQRAVHFCVAFARDKTDFLELGIGHGIALKGLAEHFNTVQVLEGSKEVISDYSHVDGNIHITETYFEDFSTEHRFHNIGMGFVLEHVDDPVALLIRYKSFLRDDGSLFAAVPNAASLHRVLAIKAGLLDDLHRMSEADLAFGHKRFFSYDKWMDLFAHAGLDVVTSKGLYLKPFSTGQLEMLRLQESVFTALQEVAEGYPEISNACFFQLRKQ